MGTNSVGGYKRVCTVQRARELKMWKRIGGKNRYGCYVQMSALFAVVLKMDSGFKKVDFNREKKKLEEREREKK